MTTGEAVIRETHLPGAILTRVAASHLRVGTFHYAVAGCTVEELRALADYAISAIIQTLREMKTASSGYTNTFRSLTFGKTEGTDVFGSPEFSKWHDEWQARLGRQEETIESSQELMRTAILR